HDDAPAGHVFTAVVAHTFHDGVHAGVAHAEALACHAAHVRLAARGAIEGHVADDDVLLGAEAAALWRVDDQPPARQPLTEVVVGVALQFQRHALGHERP